MATAPVPDRLTLSCSGCDVKVSVKPTKAGAPRPPVGWKRAGEQLFCRDCKAQRYHLRTITFPVAGVLDGEWKDFLEALMPVLRATHRLANWATRQLALADCEASEGQVKFPKAPAIYLYGKWNKSPVRADWPGSAASANAVLRYVQQRYNQMRFAVIARNEANFPRYRSLPYPVAAQVLKLAWHEPSEGTRQPAVIVHLGDRRWTLRLRNGPQFRQKVAVFGAMVSGETLMGAGAIYLQRSSGGAHRRGASSRSPGGGNRSRMRVMVRLVAHLPRGDGDQRAGVLKVRTGSRCLLVASRSRGVRPWLVHADHLRRLAYGHEQRLGRRTMSTASGWSGKATRERLIQMSVHYARRMDSELRRIAADVARFAEAQRVAELQYSDTIRKYCPSLPWAKLSRYLAEACERRQISFVPDPSAAALVDDALPPEFGEAA